MIDWSTRKETAFNIAVDEIIDKLDISPNEDLIKDLFTRFIKPFYHKENNLKPNQQEYSTSVKRMMSEFIAAFDVTDDQDEEQLTEIAIPLQEYALNFSRYFYTKIEDNEQGVSSSSNAESLSFPR